MPPILTFDLGTTYFKAVLFNGQAEPIAIARRPTPFGLTASKRVEMPAQTFYSTLCDLTAELRQQHPGDYTHVAAISFASQANTFLLLDEQDQPITPLIAWTDLRATDDQKDWIASFDSLPQRYARTGVPAVKPNLAPTKLHWIKQHTPNVWRKARKFCLISDELTRWLSGSHVTEVGVAGLTGLLDIHSCQWWQPALDCLGLDLALLPNPVRAGTDVGSLTTQAAAALELPESVRVVVGCLDQYAGAIAAGNLAPGHISETTGTVLAVVSAADHFDPALKSDGVFQGPTAKQGLYYRMVFSSISANLLDAYQREYAPELTFEQLSTLAEQTPRSITTKLDVKASEDANRPVFTSAPATHGEATRCIMQAVADRFKEHLDTLKISMSWGIPPHVTCLGGASRSDIWRQIKQETIGLPMFRIPSDEPTSLGAAVCARESLSRKAIAK